MLLDFPYPTYTYLLSLFVTFHTGDQDAVTFVALNERDGLKLLIVKSRQILASV